MKTLPVTLLLEKNLLHNTAPWYLLLDVELATGLYLYLVANIEAVTFNGHEYTPFPFKIGVEKHTSKGEIPTIQFQVCNINQVMQAYIEQYEGLLGNDIIMRLVHSDNLTEDYAELTTTYEVLTCHTDAQWAVFECGAPNPMRKRFPLYRYIGNHCNWGFKSAECSYVGAVTTCKRTLADCQALGNSKRFGGYKGLVGGGIRLA
jgi:lambda family phage minor tail protein L